MYLFEKIDKIKDNENYIKGFKYEYGVDVPRDYQTALKYYKIAASEGHKLSKDKVKCEHLDRKGVLFNSVFFVLVLLYSLYYNHLWFTFLASGTAFTFTSVIHLKRYWIRTGYAFIVNIITFFVSVLVILPLSSVLPYLYGISTLPLTLLAIIGFFVFIVGIILYFSEKEFKYILVILAGVIHLIIVIVVFNIRTPDTKFLFKEVDGGVEITGLKTTQQITEIPRKINNRPVVSIGSYAFANSQIETLTIPDSVLTIKPYAFYNNNKLISIELPENIKLSEGVFALTTLEKVTLPNNMIEIPDYLFFGSINLREIQIPNSVKKIGTSAFMYTFSIEEINLPNGVTTIGDKAFSQMNIKSFIMPDTVVEMGTGVFKNTIYLEDVHLSTNLKEIPDETFYGNQSINHYVVPRHITSIGERVLEKASNLQTIELHDGITTIKSQAFCDAIKLNHVTIPDSMTHLSDGLFRNNQSLTDTNGHILTVPVIPLLIKKMR